MHSELQFKILIAKVVHYCLESQLNFLCVCQHILDRFDGSYEKTSIVIFDTIIVPTNMSSTISNHHYSSTSLFIPYLCNTTALTSTTLPLLLWYNTTNRFWSLSYINHNLSSYISPININLKLAKQSVANVPN